jgi:hypothetical protein
MPFLRKRRWLTFSLRGALLLLAILAVFLAREVSRVRTERRVARQIRDLGGDVFPGYRDDESGKPKGFVPTGVPKWLIDFVGEDYFLTIVTVNFDDVPTKPHTVHASQATDEVLALLKETPNVRELLLRRNEQLTDASLNHASGLTKLRVLAADYTSITGSGFSRLAPDNLEILSLDYTPFDDEGLRIVSSFPKLQILLIRHTKVTEEGLSLLASMKSLVKIDLRGNDLPNEACESLERALPGCRILWDRNRAG